MVLLLVLLSERRERLHQKHFHLCCVSISIGTWHIRFFPFASVWPPIKLTLLKLKAILTSVHQIMSHYWVDCANFSKANKLKNAIELLSETVLGFASCRSALVKLFLDLLSWNGFSWLRKTLLALQWWAFAIKLHLCLPSSGLWVNLTLKRTVRNIEF